MCTLVSARGYVDRHALREIRCAYQQDGKSIREIAWDLRLFGNTGLGKRYDGNQQFVGIMAFLVVYRLKAVASAYAEALTAKNAEPP